MILIGCCDLPGGLLPAQFISAYLDFDHFKVKVENFNDRQCLGEGQKSDRVFKKTRFTVSFFLVT